jgi:hypothetical protein
MSANIVQRRPQTGSIVLQRGNAETVGTLQMFDPQLHRRGLRDRYRIALHLAFVLVVGADGVSPVRPVKTPE